MALLVKMQILARIRLGLTSALEVVWEKKIIATAKTHPIKIFNGSVMLPWQFLITLDLMSIDLPQIQKTKMKKQPYLRV